VIDRRPGSILSDAMHEGLELILTLTFGLAAALVAGFLAFRLRLSPVVGYLLAGVAVGPFTPGFVAHPDLTRQLAEIGVVLLMFGVGLQFHLEELLAVRKLAVPGALLGIGISVALGTLVALGFGYGPRAATVYGLALGPASTVVLLRVLGDLDRLHTQTGHVAMGWIVIEDVFSVLALVLLPLAANEGGTTPGEVFRFVGLSLLKFAALIGFTGIVGRRMIPTILAYVARTRTRDLFTLTVLVIALGIAVGAAAVFGASMALGAFLAGMVVGQSSFASRAASEALPMRDAFAVLFFVSVGMMLDPTQVMHHLPLSLATLLVVLLGKPLLTIVAARLAGRSYSTAMTLAGSLAQIGELTFVIAGIATGLKLLPPAATQSLVLVAIVTIAASPFLVRFGETLGKRLEPHVDRERPSVPPVEPDRPRAIVVGYGPVGRVVTSILRHQKIDPCVIELNHETVDALRAQRIRAIYGDASQSAILEAAGIARASSLVFAASAPGAEAIVRLALEMNPNVRIFSRARYRTDRDAIRDAGASVVVTSETEVGLALAEHLLYSLGASPEQVEHERMRLRGELASG